MKNLVSSIFIIILFGIHSTSVFAEPSEWNSGSQESEFSNPSKEDQSGTSSGNFSNSLDNNALQSNFSTSDPNDNDSTLGGVTAVPVESSISLFLILIILYSSSLFYRKKIAEN